MKLTALFARKSNAQTPAAGAGRGQVKHQGEARPFVNQRLIANLPWVEPEDGKVFLRGGGKVWFALEFEPSSAVQVDEVRAASLSEAVRQMLNHSIPMGEGGRLIIERYTAPKRYLDHFLHNYQNVKTNEALLSRMMEAETEDLSRARLRGEITVTRFFLTCYVTVPKRQKNTPLTEREFKAQSLLVEKRRVDVFNRMQALGLRPRIMYNREAKELMYRYLNGNLASAEPPNFTDIIDFRDLDPDTLKKDRSIAPPTTRYQVAETEIGTQHPGYLTMGDRLIGIISLSNGGNGSGHQMLDYLAEALQNKHFYIMMDFEHLEQGAVRSKLESNIQELDGVVNNPILRGGAVTEARAEKARSALYAAEYENKHFWRMAITTVLYARNREELTEMLEKTKSEYSMMAGAHAFLSNEQLRKTFFDVMPFSRELTIHRVSGMCCNVADGFPKIAPWFGTQHPHMVFRNRHGSLTGINLKMGGTNYGVMVIGQSGGGKSVFNMNILLSNVPQGARAFILDPKQDYEEVTLSLSGDVITIAPEARLPDGRPVRINIFDPTPGEDQPSAEKVAFIIAVFRVLDLVPDREHQAVLEAAITQFFMLYSERVPHPQQEGEYTYIYTGGQLKDFVNVLRTLGQIGTQGMSVEFMAIRDRLSTLMQSYLASGGGVLGEFLDGETTVTVDAPCVCFDTEKMYNDPTLRALGILMVGEYMFQQAAKIPGTKIGIFEELGALAHIQELGQLVNRWFKTGRSMGMIPIGTSQEAKDFDKLGGLINNSAWIVMASLGSAEIQKLQEMVGFTDKVAALAGSLTLRPGVMGEYLLLHKVADNFYEGDVVQLWMSPEKLWTFTTKSDEKERRNLYTQQFGSRSEAILQLAAEVRARRKTL